MSWFSPLPLSRVNNPATTLMRRRRSRFRSISVFLQCHAGQFRDDENIREFWCGIFPIFLWEVISLSPHLIAFKLDIYFGSCASDAHRQFLSVLICSVAEYIFPFTSALAFLCWVTDNPKANFLGSGYVVGCSTQLPPLSFWAAAARLP
ncbi:hypothetical protein B0H11DRAFT_2103056 [Mycena galericulata]|nr:hypothetical protein B0H11DRAFT_2103056 [Mycena galericulata]